MSTSMTHESGTLLSASPPRIRPRLIEGRSNRSELSRANGSDSIARKASSAFSIALSPSHGVAPCAAVPLTSSRIASTPFACMPMWRSVGSPVIAKSPVKPLRIRNSVAAVDLLLGLLVGHDREARRARRAGVAQLLDARPSSPRARPSCRRRRARRGGRPRPAAGTAPRGRDDVEVPVEARRRGLLGARPTAASTGSPRSSSSSTAMSRDSSQPLTNPAAFRMPSGFEVS